MQAEKTETPLNAAALRSLKRLAFIRFALMFPVIGACLFLPAWSLKYWQGWLYLLVIAVPAALFAAYLFKKDPQLLARRMKTKEKRGEQKLVIKLSALLMPLIFILPGFDWRLGWSRIPLAVELAGVALVLLGYGMVTVVLKANSFASRVVEVESEQTVITTGPYAIVRHPMYSSLVVFYLATPLALGSYWTLIPAFLFLLVFIPRILGEERELTANLPGYRDYVAKVRYRLVPGLW